MADTPVPTPADTAPENTPQPNYAARSALRIMRRAEQSLSPWARRVLQTSQPGPIQRSAQPASSEGGGLFGARRPMALTSQTTLGLFNKAQRVAEQASVIQARPLARTGNGLQRMSAQVSAHFPNIARKYEKAQPASTEAIQRSDLSYASSGTPESSGGAPSLPAIETPDSEPAVSFSPDTSLTAIMASRLQAFRDGSSSATGEPKAASPRQISRMAADVAARANNQGQKTIMRRGSVEEIGARTEDLSLHTPSASPAESAPPKVQRSPEPPASKPASGRAAATQSYSEPAWMSEPDPYDIPSRPELPSVTQELTQRYMAQRSMYNAQPKSTNPDDDLPSFLRKDSSGTPAFHLSAREAMDSGASLQRKPQTPEAPPATPRPTPPTPSADRPLVAPRASLQRQAAPQSQLPAEPDAGPVASPSVAPASQPTVQRSTAPTEPPSAESAPAGTAPTPSAPPTVQRSPTKSPAGPSQSAAKSSQTSKPRATIQRKPLARPVSPASQAERPLVTPAAPTVQRSPEPPTPDTPATPSDSAPSASIAPVQPSIQRSPAPPAPTSAADLPLQRQVASPTPSTPALSAVPTISPEPSTSAPSAAPSIQRQAAPAPQSSAPASTSLPFVQRRAAEPASTPVANPPASGPSTPAASPTPTVQRQSANLPTIAPSATSGPAPTTSPSFGQSVINRAQSSISLPLSQPSTTVQRQAPPVTPPVSPHSAPAIIGQGAATATPTPAIQRSADSFPPLAPLNAPLVSPARAPRAVQRRLDAPASSLSLDLDERPSDAPFSAHSTAPAATLQRALDTDNLPLPTLPLAVNQAPASVQREIDPGESSTSSGPINAPATNGTGTGPDLQELARRIYPILKRMFAIERERR